MLQIQIEKILKNKNLAITKNRKKVLKVFISIAKPLSLKTLKSSARNIDRVTLFRILSVFVEHQIIHEINLDATNKLYALCDPKCQSHKSHVHHHIHFQCTSCLDVICLDVDDYPKLSVPNYIINNLDVNATGICAQCC